MTQIVILTVTNYRAILEGKQMSKEGETRERVYDFLIRYKIENQGNTPTISEIMEALGLSTKSVVTHHLDKLHDDGLIIRECHTTPRARNIYIPGASWTLTSEDGRTG